MFDRTLKLIEQSIITVGLAVATLLLFTNVVLRYAFDTGIPWVLEAVEYLFAWVVLIGAAYGFRVGAHLGIDIVVEKFSRQNQRRLALLATALSLLFVVLVLYYSVVYTVKIYQWGDLTLDLRIPQWIPYLAIPVGLSLMLLHLVQVGIDIWTGKAERIHSNEASDALKNVRKLEE